MWSVRSGTAPSGPLASFDELSYMNIEYTATGKRRDPLRTELHQGKCDWKSLGFADSGVDEYDMPLMVRKEDSDADHGGIV